MEEKKTRKIGVIDIVVAVFGLILCLGSKLIFTACEVGEDMIMSCHWAEQMMAALGCLIALEGLAMTIFGEKARFGGSIATLLTAILAFVTPGGLINLCKMADMHCNMMLRPFAIVMSVLIAIVSVVNIVLYLIKKD